MTTRSVTALVLGIFSLAFLAGCEPATPPAAEVKTDIQKDELTKTEETKASVVVSEEDAPATAVDTSEVAFTNPMKLDTKTVVKNYLDKMIDLTPDYYKDNGSESQEAFLTEGLHFYDVGEIKLSPYEGQQLVVMVIDCDGPCFTTTISRFARDEKSGELTYLDAMSNEDYMPEYLEPLMKNADEDFSVKALNLPKTIMLPDGSNSVSLSIRDADFHNGIDDPDTISYVTFGKVAFTDPKWGDVYMSDHNAGCVYLRAADHSVAIYYYDAKLLNETASHSIIWKDGSDTTWLSGLYVAKSGGCGIGNSCYMIEEVETNQLVEAGTSDQGIKMYLAKETAKTTVPDKTSDEKVNFPQQDLNSVYETYLDMFQYYPEETRPERPDSYEEFISKKPIIYWQDPFGRYTAMIRSEYRPPAECGKPVIYLYPEKTTAVSVKVNIDEFTVTEPDYGHDGWKVIVDTKSNILNLADGKTYPYLFWEGKSSKSLDLTGGFVIAKADVDSFLTDSLDKLGLNEKESADFRDFWVSKMQDVREPYLLVSFVGTSDFNKIAPLDISPAPDTLIRVFMYYQPLWQPISLPAQTLSSPERNGFTVVEWGGTSSDGWQTK